VVKAGIGDQGRLKRFSTSRFGAQHDLFVAPGPGLPQEFSSVGARKSLVEDQRARLGSGNDLTRLVGRGTHRGMECAPEWR
jgi:hypothetical protein